MALTRAALREMGITEKEQLDAIMEAHGASLESAKEKAKETAETAAQKTIDGLQAKVNDLQSKVDSIPTDTDDWKAKYDAEVTAHKATVDGYKAEKEAIDIDNKISGILKSANFNEKSLGDLMNDKRLDRSIVKRDKDGNISNAEEIVTAVKSLGNWGECFDTDVIVGANVATPPKPVHTKPNYVSQLEAARQSGKTEDAVRIKTEAAKDGVFLI